MAAFIGTCAFFIVPETFKPILLKRKARQLRFQTGNWALHALREEEKVSIKDNVTRYILRPVTMLFTEAILFLVTLYLGFVFGQSVCNVSEFDWQVQKPTGVKKESSI